MSAAQATPENPTLHKQTGRFNLDIPMRSLPIDTINPGPTAHGSTNGLVWGTGVLFHDEFPISRKGELTTLTIRHPLHAADCGSMDEAGVRELMRQLKYLHELCVDDSPLEREPRALSITMLKSLVRSGADEDAADVSQSIAFPLGHVREVDAANFRLVRPVQIKGEEGEWRSVKITRHKGEIDNKIHDLLDQTVEETLEAWMKAVFETGGPGYERSVGSVTSLAERRK
ncbi:hypothetical protein LTR95_001579 [Oleoguttula sp. CCFEE 5521]